MATTELMVMDDEQALEGLTIETLDTLRNYKEQLQALDREMKTKALTIGRLLTEINDLLASQKFTENWIERTLGWSLRTAYNYMAVYRTFGALESGAELAALPIPQSGLYLLASDKVSGATRDAIVARARQGELFSIRKLKHEIQKQAAPPKEKSDTTTLPPTECLWCGAKNVMVYPLRNTRRGFCGECGAKGLQFIANMQVHGLVPDTHMEDTDGNTP